MDTNKEFNYIKFRKLIEDTFGPNSLSRVAKNLPVSRTTLSKWIYNNSKNGPTGESWDKIKILFKKHNVTIKPNDFYCDKDEIDIPKPEVSKTAIFEEPPHSYDNDNDNDDRFEIYITLFRRQNQSIKERDEMISKLYNELNIRDLKIHKLKKLLRDNDIPYPKDDK